MDLAVLKEAKTTSEDLIKNLKKQLVDLTDHNMTTEKKSLKITALYKRDIIEDGKRKKQQKNAVEKSKFLSKFNIKYSSKLKNKEE